MKELARVVVIGFVFIGLVGVVSAEKLTPAEEMTRCLPDGTIGFIGGSGMDSIGPAFDKTALGKVLGNDQLGVIFEGLWPQAMAAAEKGIGDPEAVKAAKLFIELARIVCKRPVIAGISENVSGGDVPISAFVIVDAGPVRKELAKVISKIEKLDTREKIFRKLIGPSRMKAMKVCDNQYVWWGFAGRKFVLAVCDKDGLVLKNIFWPSKDIPKNLAKIPRAGDALIINYDFQAIMALMEKCMTKAAPKEFAKVKVIFEELGIADMGNVSARVGFCGADIVAGEAVEIPSPRKGIFDAYGTVDLALFDLVEPQAVKAGAVNIDLAKFFDVICAAIKKAVPENELKNISDGIAGFEKMTNIDIREGLIGSISGEGIAYSIPAGVMMESPSGGFVVIAGLRNDGAKFAESMNALGQFVQGKSRGMLQISEMPKGDVQIHAWTVAPLAMMQIMPCWAIVDEQVVFASNMVLCSKAIDRLKSDDPSKDSLRSTAAFKTAVKGLPKELTSLVYTDSKVQFKQGIQQIQQILPMLKMVATQKGIEIPSLLPNFDEAIKDLKPAASYSWFDKDGAYSRYRGSGVEVGAAAVIGGGVGVATVMPALAKAKKAAKKVASAANLKQIGNACNVYAFDYEDTYPPNLKILIKEADLSPKCLVSLQKPKNFKGPSYIYIPGQSGASNPANILVYENTEYQCDSTTALFVDGHIEKLKAACFIKKLNETYKRLGKKAPKIKFLKDINREKKLKKPEVLIIGPDQKKKQKQQDEKFQQQMKESHEKVKKHLEEKEKEKKKKSAPKPKRTTPKVIKAQGVAKAA